MIYLSKYVIFFTLFPNYLTTQFLLFTSSLISYSLPEWLWSKLLSCSSLIECFIGFMSFETVLKSSFGRNAFGYLNCNHYFDLPLFSEASWIYHNKYNIEKKYSIKNKPNKLNCRIFLTFIIVHSLFKLIKNDTSFWKCSLAYFLVGLLSCLSSF